MPNLAPLPDLAPLLERLGTLLGPRGLLTDAADLAPHLTDWRDLYHGRTPCVLRPGNTAELAEAVRLCAAAGVALVPQGGNTSMVGGATPDEGGGQVVVSLARLNRIRDLDPVDMTMTAEAGVILKSAQDAAAAADCLFPLSLGGEGSATIGGVLSTNAGGNTTVRYGNARDLMLGLEVVLPDGQVWHGLRRLRKDNTGYALRHLFVGAEGTLGFITAAVLRLFPRARSSEVALCAVPDEDAALALFRRFRAQDETAVRAFEYMSGQGVALFRSQIEGAAVPLPPADHYVLVDLAASCPEAGLRALLESVLEAALEEGIVLDAAVAESEAQRTALWRIREEHPEAQKRAGASVKNDVSVPVSRVPELIRRASEACRALIPGVRPVPFGHLGDGNLHVNVLGLAPEDEAADLAVLELAAELGGSSSAEHGIGRLKTDMLADWRGGTELDLMRRIKAAIDPAGLLNPGKMLP